MVPVERQQRGHHHLHHVKIEIRRPTGRKVNPGAVVPRSDEPTHDQVTVFCDVRIHLVGAGG
jgi:hypothetical protein